jgi:DNA-binding NarL/FixJ family response regulator
MTRCVVVEDDWELRKQLVELMATAPDIQCVGAFESGEVALKEIPTLKPDVVLMDIQLPRMSGIRCVSELKSILPELRVIMVTIYEDSERIFKALKAGATGYLLKSSHALQILDAVRDAHSGGAPMSSHIASKVVEHFHSLGPSPGEDTKLTPREEQVLNLLCSGFIYKEIADKMNIKVTTVRYFVQNFCQKLHVRNRLEAVAKYQAKTG